MISYIVAIYNVKEYLDECIMSVIRNKDDIEVLLVDDGSTDGSSEVCDAYALKDQRIRVLHQKNQGVSVARNNGLRHAKGDWICFIDGDDKINSNLNNAVPCILDTDADMAIFQYTMDEKDLEQNTVAKDSSKVLSRDEIIEMREGLLNSDAKKMSYYKNNNYNCHAPWGKLYKKDFLMKNRLEFVPGIKKGQDMLFNFDVYQCAQKVQLIPFGGYYYRIRQDSIGHKYNKNIVEINIQLISEFKKRISENSSKQLISNYHLMAIRQFVFSMLLDCCHPLNKKTYVLRRKEFLKYRDLSIFEHSFCHADIGQFRFQVKVFALMAKYKCFIGMCFISKIKSIIEK